METGNEDSFGHFGFCDCCSVRPLFNHFQEGQDMKANQVGTQVNGHRVTKEICVICSGYHEAMYRDCHGQSICSKECQEVYLDMGDADRHELH